MEAIIRREQPEDRRAVEELTRRAFWDLHAPGCDEHYLVHRLRSHPDFLPELNFVLEQDGRLLGSILFTRARLTAEDGTVHPVVTFGPVSIEPAQQRKGHGKRLIGHALDRARDLGWDLAVIFGNPANYVSLGFRSSSRYGIFVGDRVFPTALLVKELGPPALKEGFWRFEESEAYTLDPDEADRFDRTFEPRGKRVLARQEEFYILSRSTVTAG